MATDYVVRFTGQDNLSGTINQVRQHLEDVGSSTTQLDSIQQKFQKIEQSTAPLKRKLRDLKNLMAQMNLDGLSGTDLFNRMAQQAGTYADAIGDATTATNVFANDNFKLEAMAQGLTGIAGAASIATGVMGVLGTENEKVSQAIMKVQSVLAILNGVQAVANVLNKDSALMLRLKQIRTAASTAATRGETAALGANTVAQAVNGATTKKGTLIQNAWNVAKAVSKALLGDFTGLVLVGAGALLTYALATDNSADKLEDQAKATDKAKEAMTKYKDDVASSTGQLVGKYKLLQNEWNNLKTVGEKTQWIKDNATEFKNLGVKVTDLKSAEDVFVNNTSNVVTALKARASAMAAQTMLTDAYTEYYKTIMAADGSVSGGGFYNKYSGRGAGWSKNNPNITDEMRAAGVTNADFNQRTTTTRTGGMVYDTTEYQESQTVIDKVNAYRMQQARATNQRIHTEAEQQLNKTVDFATTKINEAQRVIDANGLDFNQNNGGGGNGSGNKGTTVTPDKGSLAAEEAELTRLQTALKNTRFESDAAREAAMQAVRDQAAKVEQMKLQLKWQVEPELDLSDDTITGLTNQIQAIEKRLKDEVLTPSERQQLVTDREVKIRLKEQLEVSSGLKEQKTEKPKTKSELYNELKGMGGDIQSDFDNGLIDKEEAIKRISEINAQIAVLGGKPIQLEFKSNMQELVDEFNTGMSAIQGIDGVVNSVKSLSQSLQEGADAWEIFMGAVNVASSVLNAISTIMETVNLLSSIHTATKTTESAATTAAATAQGVKAGADTASIAPAIAATVALKAQEAAYLDLAAAAYFAAHASIPFAGFGIAAGFVSGMMGMMAAQTAASAAIAAFADGGIISGNTFHGDRMLARVNAGEMILNQTQQANLFRALNSGNAGGGVTVSDIKIKGSDLHIVLKNYNNKMGKIK